MHTQHASCIYITTHWDPPFAGHPYGTALTWLTRYWGGCARLGRTGCSTHTQTPQQSPLRHIYSSVIFKCDTVSWMALAIKGPKDKKKLQTRGSLTVWCFTVSSLLLKRFLNNGTVWWRRKTCSDLKVLPFPSTRHTGANFSLTFY